MLVGTVTGHPEGLHEKAAGFMACVPLILWVIARPRSVDLPAAAVDQNCLRQILLSGQKLRPFGEEPSEMPPADQQRMTARMAPVASSVNREAVQPTLVHGQSTKNQIR